jgi:hydroxymethylglutaryl-CoA reductase (NADPH)
MPGIDIPPLDATLLDTYFGAFIRDGNLPAALPPEGGSHMNEGLRWLPPTGGTRIAAQLLLDGGQDLSDLTVTPLAAADSIISELTAWRSGSGTGLFDVRAGGRRYVLKVKPHADEAHAVGLALAGICSSELADTYRMHGRGLGLEGGHERELALYRDADDIARQYMPRATAQRADAHTRTWAVLLEYISDGMLLDSADRPGEWTREHIETAIDGIAALHAAWHGRVHALRRQPWFADLRSTRNMESMAPLWRAMADHAGPMFSAWTNRSMSALQQDLIDRIGEWRPALERIPQTLVHNDFNPRNVCLRSQNSGPMLCAFDWELATIGAPVRDLAEFLCFVLPPGVNADLVAALVDQHLARFARKAGVEPDRATWRAGFNAALCELLVDRLSVYAMVHRVRAQAFLPRVLRTWTTLYALSSES